MPPFEFRLAKMLALVMADAAFKALEVGTRARIETLMLEWRAAQPKPMRCGNCKHQELPKGADPCLMCVAGDKWEPEGVAELWNRRAGGLK